MSHFLDDMPDSPPPLHTRRSADLWALARSDYLAGGSAPEVCERHGLSLSTFRWRARHEGWRRADQPETPIDSPYLFDPDDGSSFENNGAEAELERPSPTEGLWVPASPAGLTGDADIHHIECEVASAADLAKETWTKAELAIRRGHMIEARGWTRLHRETLAMTRDHTTALKHPQPLNSPQYLAQKQQASAALNSALAELKTSMASLRNARPSRYDDVEDDD